MRSVLTVALLTVVLCAAGVYLGTVLCEARHVPLFPSSAGAIGTGV